jgi:predicted Ser/Thr protein kinase
MSDSLKDTQTQRMREAELAGDAAGSGAEPEGGEGRKEAARAALGEIATGVEAQFHQGNRLLSFAQYLDLFASHPARYGRNAAQYVRDMFAFYGTRQVERPWGEMTRFALFDAPWAAGESLALQPRLVGQELLQGEIFRALFNFCREGRANRLLLMHGPNGSSKSTAAACILRALENYSQRDEGALYRFHWIFPSRKTSRGALGFGGGKPVKDLDSFAHLEDADIDARLVIELRDHPLFLLPLQRRRDLIDRLWRDAGVNGKPSEWLYDAELSHKNKQIYEALLADYNGSLLDVLRHVQVERYFISRRYRVGAVTLGPEMSVDASERQVTADRSLSALPTSLQATTLFEAHGEIVDAAGGVLEFSDLLKRPIDTFRYLQLSLETGEVSLSQQTIVTNVVMIGSANEIHLSAFREHPEYPSFRGRVELMRVPYLKNFYDEELIYLMQIVPQLRRHVAPHTIRLAAEFAVLTRMRRPDPNRYDKPLRDIVDSLTAIEKLDLYADGVAPKRLRNEERKILRANIALLYHETDNDVDYEGNIGVSPRSVRTLLLDAAQSGEFECVSPFALLKCIDALCRRTAEFEWLKLKPLSGGYHDHKHFREVVRERLMDRTEADMRAASGLIEEGQYARLFTRYISHVSAWVKGEKMRNKITNRDEDPDEKLMREVESLFDSKADPREQRDGMISMIAAWAIDHPGKEPVVDEIFPDHVKRLEKAAYEQKRRPIAQLLRAVVALLRDDGLGLEPSQRRDAEKMVERLREVGYDAHSVGDAASALLRERYGDLVA